MFVGGIDYAQMGFASPFQGEGEGEGITAKTPHLSPLPSLKGRGGKPRRLGLSFTKLTVSEH
jgi:hypothetical protein